MGAISCRLPEDLYYWPERHVWARPEADGTVVIGITDPAQGLAGRILVASLRSAGRTLERGKSVGTLESSKWVGPVPTPVGGEVVMVNEVVRADPGLLNRDPYGQGWVARLRPADWAADAATLQFGPAAVAGYRQALVQAGIDCREGG